MKKIIAIHHSGRIGGAGVSLRNTVVTLKEYYEVIVYCPAYPSDYANLLIAEGIDVRTYDYQMGSIAFYSGGPRLYTPSFIQSLFNIRSSREKLKSFLVKEQPDLILVNSKTLSWVSQLCIALRLSCLCYVRETRKKTMLNFLNSIIRSQLEKFNAVIFISDFDRRQERLTKTNTIVIPNFIDFDKYLRKVSLDYEKSLTIPHDAFKVLFVGGVLRIKGYETALLSIHHLIKDEVNVLLIVAGNSEFEYLPGNGMFDRIYNYFKRRYANNISKLEMELEKKERLFKTGVTDHMPTLYSIADVLIFPATEPHQARPAFEAGAFSKPIIMPDFENTKEYLRNMHNGLVFKPNDAVDLSRKIKILAEDPIYSKMLGKNNREHTIKHHTQSSSAKSILNIVENILSSNIGEGK